MAAMNMVSAVGFSGVNFHLRRCPQGVASVLCKKTPFFGSRRSKLDHLTVVKRIQCVFQFEIIVLLGPTMPKADAAACRVRGGVEDDGDGGEDADGDDHRQGLQRPHVLFRAARPARGRGSRHGPRRVRNGRRPVLSPVHVELSRVHLAVSRRAVGEQPGSDVHPDGRRPGGAAAERRVEGGRAGAAGADRGQDATGQARD